MSTKGILVCHVKTSRHGPMLRIGKTSFTHRTSKLPFDKFIHHPNVRTLAEFVPED